ncbi:MAG: hypothetical protein GY861_24125 [bacterium]|nr:hypothetical protein [bacterium]
MPESSENRSSSRYPSDDVPQCPRCKSFDVFIKDTASEMDPIDKIPLYTAVLTMGVWPWAFEQKKNHLKCRDCGCKWEWDGPLHKVRPSAETEFACPRCDGTFYGQSKTCPHCGKQLTEVIVRKRQ